MDKMILPRILVAGTGSGSGKTTMMCALLMALKKRGKTPAAFKCGPDYIDPMFHRKVTGVASRNLDLFLMGPDSLIRTLASHAAPFDVAILEGAMGLYDGIEPTGDASANEISLCTQTPVLLTVGVEGKARSICAEIKGFLEFSPNLIQGVLLNHCSHGMFPYYKELIEGMLPIPVVGYLPFLPEAEIGSRNLGLISADEIEDLKLKLERLGATAYETIDWPCFDSLVDGAKPLTLPQSRSSIEGETCGVPGGPGVAGRHNGTDWAGSGERSGASQRTEIDGKGKMQGKGEFQRDGGAEKPVIIYVSKDQAFCFYYEENIELLADLGAEIRYFSPLEDPFIPEEADGVILWGGYPQLYGPQIGTNDTLRQDLHQKAVNGLPIYAECGGYMFLHEAIVTSDAQEKEQIIPGVGIFPGRCIMTNRLQDFGYATLEVQEDNYLFLRGETLRCHSFHRSRSETEGRVFLARKASGTGSYETAQSRQRVLGGYAHLHFTEIPQFATRFIEAATAYQREKKYGLD